MISLRYHVVSISAVFLALAVGVVLGASGVSERLLSSVSARSDDLGAQVQTLTAERDTLAAAQRASDEFAQRVGSAAVRNLLEGRTVTLVSAGADPADRTALVDLIKQSGAVFGGEVALTPAVGDPARADQVRRLTAELLPAGAELPAASDTGSLVGGLLSGVLLAPGGSAQITGQQSQTVLDGLAVAGFVEPGDRPRPGEVVLTLTGGAVPGLDGADAAAVVARMAAQLDRSAGRSGGVVLAGRTGSAEPTGAVGVARADSTISQGVSTVDDVHTGSGRVSTVLALREQLDGRAGSYGIARNATDGATPAA